MKKTFLLSFIIASMMSTYGQTPAPEDSSKKISFRISSEYLSNYIYNGRADSLRSPYLISTIEMNLWNGFTLSASLNYLMGATPRIDQVSVDASYEYDFSKYFSGSLYASKYFNSAQRTTLNSSIGGSVGAGGGISVKNYRLFTEADLYFGTANDLFLYTEFSREWTIAKSNIDWTITPAISFNANTLGYYGGSVTRNTQRKSRRTGTAATTVVKSTSVVNPGMKLMDFECSLPVGFEKRNFGMLLTATWANPLNPVTTTSVVTRGTVTNTVNSTPYAEKNLKQQVFTELLFFVKF